MRVRPAIWLILIISSLGIMIFAVLHEPLPPLKLSVEQQHTIANGVSMIEVHVTDTQGLPVNEAEITPQASMTNMDMIAYDHHVKQTKSGRYIIYLDLYMEGPWAITIAAEADGFHPIEHTILVEVP